MCISDMALQFVQEHSFHSVPTFLLQIVSIILVVGFTSPSSPMRLAALPLVTMLTFSIVLTSSIYMRERWSSLFSGTSVGFLLQYIDLALLSKWSFEANGPSLRGLARRQLTVKTKAKDSSPRGVSECQAIQTPNPLMGSFLQETSAKFRFGLSSTFSFRNVNTPNEVKNVPYFSSSDPGYRPTRSRFLLGAITTTFTCFLILDVLASVPPPPDEVNAQIFSPENVPLLMRLTSVTSEEMTTRFMGTAVYWISMYCVMQLVTSFFSILFMASGISSIQDWRPLFGSISDAWTLHRLWGNFWHQVLRQILTQPSRYITHTIIFTSRDTPGTRYTKLVLTFLISGLLHTFAELGGGLPLSQSGTLRFFLTQAFGMMVEDGVEVVLGIVYHLAGIKVNGTLARGIGYIWVIGFLVWSTPAWLYPQAVGPAKADFLPFSMVRKFV